MLLQMHVPPALHVQFCACSLSSSQLTCGLWRDGTGLNFAKTPSALLRLHAGINIAIICCTRSRTWDIKNQGALAACCQWAGTCVRCTGNLMMMMREVHCCFFGLLLTASAICLACHGQQGRTVMRFDVHLPGCLARQLVSIVL
jgi:cytochrome c553